MKATTILVLFVCITCVSGSRCPPKLRIVKEGTRLEDVLVKQFIAENYTQIVVPENSPDQFHYKVSFSSPIRAAFLIVPKVRYLNGTVTTYQEGVDFSSETRAETISLWFYDVGYFMLTVYT